MENESLTGFERLCKIMDIKRDEPEPSLATYHPVWSSQWLEYMNSINDDEDGALSD